MRRTATVTICVPEASSASCISSSVAYFPVPTINLERNSLPAITKGLSFMCFVSSKYIFEPQRSQRTRRLRFTLRSLRLKFPAAHKMDNFQLVVRRDFSRGKFCLRYDFEVLFHGSEKGIYLQNAQQFGNRCALRQLHEGSIHRHLKMFLLRCQLSSSC